MDFRITSLILLLHISDSLTLKHISVICKDICALSKTDVRLKCTYDNIHTKTAFWFSEKQSKNWRRNNEPEDLTLDSDYSGRVKQIIGKYEAELRISDVRERDSGEYQLMFVDDGVKLLSSAAVSLTVTGVSQRGCWDVTYTSRRVCALVGSTVDISSTYSHPSGYTVNKTFWYYVQPGNFKDLREDHQFAGRVEYVGNKLRIKDLKISDSGEYRLRIITDLNGTYSASPGVILTVTDTQMKISPVFVSEGQEVILICSTKCTLNDEHTYIWYKNGRQVTDGFTKANKLYLDSVSNEELQQYSCAVGDPVNSTAVSHYTVTLLVFLPQFLIIAALWMWFFIRMHLISKQN
ncbi:uncharacterized protein LOC131530672 [Onychostoma macrolepis]|uniref:Ig-like domain-containing protein n=1 Tax=Onychostoma macrolepis TaxID=369639 RepID=A0A7J6BSS1_9TELE|nr:uncharacterized protein LOC131530672 [Onychostoma macrolepis]KAF4097791.1 hypothetical protein G5714_021799 [Onychostoma macrolepis]